MRQKRAILPQLRSSTRPPPLYNVVVWEKPESVWRSDSKRERKKHGNAYDSTRRRLLDCLLQWATVDDVDDSATQRHTSETRAAVMTRPWMFSPCLFLFDRWMTMNTSVEEDIHLARVFWEGGRECLCFYHIPFWEIQSYPIVEFIHSVCVQFK